MAFGKAVGFVVTIYVCVDDTSGDNISVIHGISQVRCLGINGMGVELVLILSCHTTFEVTVAWNVATIVNRGKIVIHVKRVSIGVYFACGKALPVAGKFFSKPPHKLLWKDIGRTPLGKNFCDKLSCLHLENAIAALGVDVTNRSSVSVFTKTLINIELIF